MLFNRVIVSSDDGYFLDFWPLVSTAWKKFFPLCRPTLAFVSRDISKLPYLRNFGDVIHFPPNKNAPHPNQGKLARFYAAGLFEDEIITIEDLDTAPLQKDWFEKTISTRKENTLLLVGSEVYSNGIDRGKCPISTMTAEGRVFRSFFNQQNLEFPELIDTFNIPQTYLPNENPFNAPENFSDESLLRVLIEKTKIETTKIVRSCNIKQDWIDRSWWNININKLNQGKYICCNFLRPYNNNKEKIKPIEDYINGAQNV